MRTFEYKDRKTHKFWNIELQGKSFTVTSGKVGTKGRSQTRKFASPATAQKEHDRFVADKLMQGYTETFPTPGPASPLQQSLEQSLVENADDLATHSAYADYLNEQGDPRGEFIQVQLALENESLPATERKKLQKREKDLLKAHERRWLGELAPVLLDQAGVPVWLKQSKILNRFQWRRGWIERVEYVARDFEFTEPRARHPLLRLLRSLVLMDTEYVPELPDAPWMATLTHLQVGADCRQERPEEFNCGWEGAGVDAIVACAPRLERLHLFAHSVDTRQLFALPTLGNLRELVLFHLHHHAWDVLARNPAVANLETILAHPGQQNTRGDEGTHSLKAVRPLFRSKHLKRLRHLGLRLSDMGDAGIAEVIASGILGRLATLDLRHGCITDAGARLLAGEPATAHLEALDLGDNELTAAGVEALETAGVRLIGGDAQHSPGSGSWVYMADIE
jgi:uncharacterized protein (TIGR02996 family)